MFLVQSTTTCTDAGPYLQQLALVVSSYINRWKYSTCTCGDDHLLQLALVVFYLPATGANTPFARVQLALCGGGGCVVVLQYMW